MTHATATTTIRNTQINLRARAQDKALIEHAAKLRGMKVSSFIMRDAIKHAKQILEEEGVMILDEGDRQAFVRAFLEPHDATPYMKRAIKSHKQD